MQNDLNSIYDAALKLPEPDRLMLVSKIMESMPVENLTVSLDDPAFIDELNRRSADTESAVPWSELRAES